MKENLLYPKVQTALPLYVNPSAMFKTSDGIYDSDVTAPLINACPHNGFPPTIRFLDADVNRDRFSIGLIFDLNKVPRLGNMGFIPLVLQEIGEVNIREYACLGWHATTKNLTSTPDKEIDVPAGAIQHGAGIFAHPYEDFVQGDEPLFIMKGTEPLPNGLLPTFFSVGAYSAVEYVVLPTFVTSAIDGPFHDMYQEFHTNNFTDGMLAIEVRIDIVAAGGSFGSDFFSIGLWDPSMG